MGELPLENFCDSYIDEMIQAEIELEKQIFYDNLPEYVKLSNQLVKDLAENLRKEIDAEIIRNLYGGFISLEKIKIENALLVER